MAFALCETTELLLLLTFTLGLSAYHFLTIYQLSNTIDSLKMVSTKP